MWCIKRRDRTIGCCMLSFFFLFFFKYETNFFIFFPPISYRNPPGSRIEWVFQVDWCRAEEQRCKEVGGGGVVRTTNGGKSIAVFSLLCVCVQQRPWRRRMDWPALIANDPSKTDSRMASLRGSKSNYNNLSLSLLFRVVFIIEFCLSERRFFSFFEMKTRVESI